MHSDSDFLRHATCASKHPPGHWPVLLLIMIAILMDGGLVHKSAAQGYSFTQIWYDTNLFSTSVLQDGGYNRSVAFSAVSNQLFVANRTGSLAGISVLNPGDGSVIGSVNGADTIQPDQILVGDDGILYAIPLDQTITSANFKIYSWSNWNNLPFQCYVPTGSDGTSQGIIAGFRGGDTAAITGTGTNTQILCGVNFGVATTNCALIFGTSNGVNFKATLLCITNLPASYSDLGPAHGISFYTNGTFIFKPGGLSSYLVRYPTNFASLGNPVNVGAIATNSLPGNSVVMDYSLSGGLLATIQLPQGANNSSAITLYSLTSFTGISNIVATTTPNPNSNGNDTGGIAFGGTGKTNLLFTLDSNNGLYAWNLVPGSVIETGVATPAQLSSALNTNSQGAIIGLYGVDPLSCPLVSMTQTFNGGKLIFSDSPESPTSTGMLYKDTNLTATAPSVPNRVFLYHVNNNSSGQMKFSTLIKNNGSSNATLTVLQSGTAGPSTSYAFAGETAFARWLTNKPGTNISVTAGQTVRLDTTFDTIKVSQGFLVNGIWDYTFTQPHAIMIVALNSADDPVSVGPTLAVSARDSHVRGTFASCNKSYNTSGGVVIDASAGIKQFPIGGNSDTTITGLDNAVFPPTAVTNGGNYGLLYNIQLNTSAADARALAMIFTPRGGAWSGAVNAPPGLLPGGDFLIPTGGVSISSTTNAAIAGEYFSNGGKSVQLQFMPTGASSFPVLLMTVPYSSTAPNLATISNYTVNVGQTVSFTANATDTNGNNPLVFSLPAAPAAASIGPASGVFNWRPPVASAGSTQNVQVRVIDSGSPAHSDIQTFTIAVNPLSPVSVSSLAYNNGRFQMQVAGSAGPDYILQANTNLLNSSGWTNLLTNTPSALPFTLTDTNSATFSNRFYRILLGP